MNDAHISHAATSAEQAIVRLIEAGDNMADALGEPYSDAWDVAVDAFNDARAIWPETQALVDAIQARRP